MLRIRLASVAVALGFLVTLSGCSTHDGPLFPRVHDFFVRPSETACECQAGNLPPEFAGQGPVLMAPGQTMPTITTVPSSQPPQSFKAPSATTTPYFPGN
jgi:hypothetical protein